MPLASNLLQSNERLNDCLIRDGAHLLPNDAGEHVRLVQIALRAIDGLVIDPAELASNSYGPSTAAAVLSYKTKRSIINRSRQSAPDNIVGKMTIAALDQDMLALEHTPPPAPRSPCKRRGHLALNWLPPRFPLT